MEPARPEPDSIMLGTICDGAVEERFAEKLALVLANIEDPNTLAKTTRSIVVTLTFSPGEERDAAAIGLSVEAKLAPTRPVASVVFLGRRHGLPTAIESNPKQQALFANATGKPTAVPSTRAKGE